MTADPAADWASLDDGTLVTMALAGRQTAFGEIMRRHRASLFRLIRGHVGDADEAFELVQDSFASAWQHLARFDRTRPLRPWLARIAINRSRDWHRRRALRRFIAFGNDGEAERVADPAVSPDRIAADRLELEQVWEAIAALPERLRETLLLRTVEELTQAETAEALGIGEKAVETRLYRARRRLAALLARDGEPARV